MLQNGLNWLSHYGYSRHLPSTCSGVASSHHLKKPLALASLIEILVGLIVCIVCVLFRMSSLFSRDFPPLPSQSSSQLDFSKLTQGVDYVITYTSTAQETRVLTKDLQQVAAHLPA